MLNTNSREEDVPFIEQEHPEPSSTPPAELPEPASQPHTSPEAETLKQTPVDLLSLTPQPVTPHEFPLEIPASDEASEQVRAKLSGTPTGPLPELRTKPEVHTPPFGLPVAPPIIPGQPGMPGRSSRVQRKRPSRRALTIALVVLILLLVIGGAPFLVSYLLTILPASSATLTITPTSKHLANTYTIATDPGVASSALAQAPSRLISYTTSPQSKKVKATGAAHADATDATGILTLSASSTTQTLPANVPFYGRSGVPIALDSDTTLPANGVVKAPAHSQTIGSGGNVPAFDINGYYTYVVNGVSGPLFYAENFRAFTGGRDAEDYTFLQDTDVNDVETSLYADLQPKALAAFQTQILPNERLVGPPYCAPNSKSSPAVGQRAKTATVTVSVTCRGVVYDLPATQAAAENLLRNEATAKFGPSYVLTGNILTTVTDGTVLSYDQGQASLQVKAEGVWVVLFDAAKKQKVAQLLAGKTQQDARTLLFKTAEVRKLIITTSGFGNALPSSPTDIKFVVMDVAGL